MIGPNAVKASFADVRKHLICVLAGMRGALKTSRGVPVNTASLNATLSFKNHASLAHTTAKAGIIGMTRQLAMEGREHGIRANSISPGVIETNQTREQLKDPGVDIVVDGGMKVW